MARRFLLLAFAGIRRKEKKNLLKTTLIKEKYKIFKSACITDKLYNRV